MKDTVKPHNVVGLKLLHEYKCNNSIQDYKVQHKVNTKLVILVRLFLEQLECNM